MPQKPLDSEYECGRLVARQQPSWLPAALIEACCQTAYTYVQQKSPYGRIN